MKVSSNQEAAKSTIGVGKDRTRTNSKLFSSGSQLAKKKAAHPSISDRNVLKQPLFTTKSILDPNQHGDRSPARRAPLPALPQNQTSPRVMQSQVMPPSPKKLGSKQWELHVSDVEVHKTQPTEKKNHGRFNFDDEEEGYAEDEMQQRKPKSSTARKSQASQNRRRTAEESKKKKPKKAEHNQKRIIINLAKTEYPLLERVAAEHMGWRISKFDDWQNTQWDLLWFDLGIDSVLLSTLKGYQKVNHFPAMYQIARKTFLAKNLKRMRKLFPNEFKFFPRSWVWPNEAVELRAYVQNRNNKSPMKEQSGRKLISPRYERQSVEKTTLIDTKIVEKKVKIIPLTLIVKPDCMSQGNGIFLTNDVEQIPKHECMVVQEYLPNPHLIDNLKYDIRLYVLILSCDPLKIFLYKEGLVRFATQEYVPIGKDGVAGMKNQFVHLTNYSLNKESAKFREAKDIHDETSHKRTLTVLINQLKKEGADTDRLMSEMKDVIIKTILPIQKDLAHNYHACQPADTEGLMCFELLGVDILLDSKYKPLLLEVNHAPSFATNSPLDLHIKEGLFKDLYRLLGMSPDKKKQVIQRQMESKQKAMMAKTSLKQKNIEKKKEQNEFATKQNKWEEENQGDFEKIFPLAISRASAMYIESQTDPNLDSQGKQAAGQQFQALVKQQDQYNQIVSSMSNNEAERQLRMQNRQEDVNKKAEKLANRPTDAQKLAAKKLAKKNAKLAAESKSRQRTSMLGQTMSNNPIPSGAQSTTNKKNPSLNVTMQDSDDQPQSAFMPSTAKSRTSMKLSKSRAEQYNTEEQKDPSAVNIGSSDLQINNLVTGYDKTTASYRSQVRVAREEQRITQLRDQRHARNSCIYSGKPVVQLKQQAPKLDLNQTEVRTQPILASHGAGSQMSYRAPETLPEIKNNLTAPAVGKHLLIDNLTDENKFGQTSLLQPHMNKNITVIKSPQQIQKLTKITINDQFDKFRMNNIYHVAKNSDLSNSFIGSSNSQPFTFAHTLAQMRSKQLDKDIKPSKPNNPNDFKGHIAGVQQRQQNQISYPLFNIATPTQQVINPKVPVSSIQNMTSPKSPKGMTNKASFGQHFGEPRLSLDNLLTSVKKDKKEGGTTKEVTLKKN